MYKKFLKEKNGILIFFKWFLESVWGSASENTTVF
jgi:hypothetical protein